MINDIRFYINPEQPLDVWLLEVIAVVNDATYEINSQLNQGLDRDAKNTNDVSYETLTQLNQVLEMVDQYVC